MGIKARVKVAVGTDGGNKRERGLHLKSTIEIQDPYAKRLARSAATRRGRRKGEIERERKEERARRENRVIQHLVDTQYPRHFVPLPPVSLRFTRACLSVTVRTHIV